MNLTAGATLQDGKYVIQRTQSENYLGGVYQASHATLLQPVLIQTLNPALRNYPEFEGLQQQFVAIARRLVQAQNPHLVKVLDCFEEAGVPFVVLEQCPGGTLADGLQTHPLPEHEALQVIQQVASAVQALHQQGLVHGAVNAHHLLRQSSESVLLTGFSLLRQLQQDAQEAIASFQMASAEELVPTDDVYNLSATLYHLLTGQLPIAVTAASQPALPELRHQHPHLNISVEQALVQGLQLESRLRPQTVDHWLALLNNTVPSFLVIATAPDVAAVSPSQVQDLSPLENPSDPVAETVSESVSESGLPTTLGTNGAGDRLSVVNLEAEINRVEGSNVNSAQTPSETSVETVPADTASDVEAAQPVVPSTIIAAGSGGQDSTVTTHSATRPHAQNSRGPGRAPSQRSPKVVQLVKPKSRRWLPTALVVTSMVAALAGAGFGWTLRYSGAETVDSQTGFGRDLFTSEQSFPPLEDWPDSEIPDIQNSQFLIEQPSGAPESESPLIYGADQTSERSFRTPEVEDNPIYQSDYDPSSEAVSGTEQDASPVKPQPQPETESNRASNPVDDIAPVPELIDPATPDLAPVPIDPVEPEAVAPTKVRPSAQESGSRSSQNASPAPAPLPLVDPVAPL